MKTPGNVAGDDVALIHRSTSILNRVVAHLEDQLSIPGYGDTAPTGRRSFLFTLAFACAIDATMAISDPDVPTPASGLSDTIQTMLAEDFPDLAADMMTARTLDPLSLIALAETFLAEADRIH